MSLVLMRDYTNLEIQFPIRVIDKHTYIYKHNKIAIGHAC